MISSAGHNVLTAFYPKNVIFQLKTPFPLPYKSKDSQSRAEKAPAESIYGEILWRWDDEIEIEWFLLQMNNLFQGFNIL